MSCFYKKNKSGTGGLKFEDILHIPKFYDIDKAKTVSEKQNVISVALGTIGLSLDEPPCGSLPKYDIHNMSCPQVIKLGLLEGIKDSNFYELYLDESGIPYVSEIGDTGCNINTVYYSIIHDIEKVDYCVIVKGLDPMPKRIVKEPIRLIEGGQGKGVKVYGLGMFQYETCGNKIFDYNGCISYADPNLQDTTPDEMGSAFELEPFESLIGYTFTCMKPEDVDVVFSNVTQAAVNFHVGDLKHGSTGDSVKLDVDVTEQYDEQINDSCNPCYFLDPGDLSLFYESFVEILKVDQVIFTAERITNYKTTTDTDYDDICDIGGEGGEAAGATATDNRCDFFDINIATRQLNIGQDFYYKIEHNGIGSTLYAGIPVINREISPLFGSTSDMYNICRFAGSTSHVFSPFGGVALISIDKPAIYVNKKTDSSIGNIGSTGAAFVVDHTKEIEEISKEITLIAIPIVTLDRPSNTAYYVGGETTCINMDECLQDADPTTMEDLEDTPCEEMTKATSGKATVDITLPFLEDDEEITSVATLLGEKFSAEYKQSVSTVPGHDVSSSDLGKNYNGGIINKIAWSYQDKSFYKATVTTGPFLAGTDSFNTSMWIRRTDQNLSREGIVTGDYGNGLEFKVYVRNLGAYVALNMTMNIIEIGDVVNVTIYNNPAEAYYD